jgi:hypothetical protein
LRLQLQTEGFQVLAGLLAEFKGVRGKGSPGDTDGAAILHEGSGADHEGEAARVCPMGSERRQGIALWGHVCLYVFVFVCHNVAQDVFVQ